MERNESAVACAMRVKAYGLLQELLAFQVSPAACLDEAGNRSLHYAAYYRDLAALEIVLQRCGDQWWHAVLSKNRAGETPLALAEAAGAARLGLGLRLGLRLGLGLGLGLGVPDGTEGRVLLHEERGRQGGVAGVPHGQLHGSRTRVEARVPLDLPEVVLVPGGGA